MGINWQADHAASGLRFRAFNVVPGWELIAYADGDWEVRGGRLGEAVAHGREPTVEDAQNRCARVLSALTGPLR